MPRRSPLRSCPRAFPSPPPFIAREKLSHDTSYPSGWHPLVGRAGAFELNRLRNETAPLVVWRRHGLVGSRRGLEFLANGLPFTVLKRSFSPRPSDGKVCP